MIQFKVLSGKKAGDVIVARHFPFRVGRAEKSHLRLEEPGVWDRHLEIDFRPGEGFVATAHPDAALLLNGSRTETAVLRNGDLLEIGSSKFRFSLDTIGQRSLRGREFFTWLLIGVVSVGQVALIYWILE